MKFTFFTFFGGFRRDAVTLPECGANDSHRLTGWNAVKSRVEQLNLQMSDEQVKDATAKIKELADVRTQSMEDVDMILRIYHTAIKTGELKVGQSAVLDKLLNKHMPSREGSPTKTDGENGTPAKRPRVEETTA
jgi:homocitrate synthase